MKMAACIHHIQSWLCVHAFETKCHKTELIWFDRRTRVDDNTTKHLYLDPQCSIPPSDVVRDLGVLLDCKLNMTQHVSPQGQNMLFPPSKNSTSETLSRRNMPSFSCSSSRHLPT